MLAPTKGRGIADHKKVQLIAQDILLSTPNAQNLVRSWSYRQLCPNRGRHNAPDLSLCTIGGSTPPSADASRFPSVSARSRGGTRHAHVRDLVLMLMCDASCDATPNGPAHGMSLSTVLHIVITTNQIRGGLNESSRAHQGNTSTHFNTRYLWLIVACGPCWARVTS